MGTLDVTETSLAFFQDFDASVQVGSYSKYSEPYRMLTSAIRTYADGFLRLVQTYTPANGSLAEEYSRDTGVPLSANDLTWSFASFLTATERRESIVPPSWDEKSANVVPTTCSASPVLGTYQAATSTFPTSTAGCVPATIVVPITFYLNETTFYGENVYVAGNISALGNWDTSNGFPLTAYLYTETDNLWFGTVEFVSAGTPFEYKFYKIEPDGSVIFEAGANRLYTAPTGCPKQPSIYAAWQS